MLKRYLEFVSGTRVLWAMFAIYNLISFGIFKNLPNLDGLLVDSQFSYTHNQLMVILTNIGTEGRATYLWANMVDMIYPFFYASFFAGFLYKFRAREGLWVLALVPILLAFVDWGENIQIRAMLNAFPDVSVAQVEMASLFTTTKQLLVYTMLVAFFATGGTALVRRFVSKK